MLNAEAATGEGGESIGDHLHVGVRLPSYSLSEHLLGDDVANVAEVRVEGDGIASEVFDVVVDVQSRDGRCRGRVVGWHPG